MNAHKVPSRSMAIENLMNSQKTALLRPRVLQEALVKQEIEDLYSQYAG